MPVKPVERAPAGQQPRESNQEGREASREQPHLRGRVGEDGSAGVGGRCLWRVGLNSFAIGRAMP